MSQTSPVSVVITLVERGDEFPAVLDSYYESLSSLEIEFEVIIVLTPDFEYLADTLISKNEEMGCIKIILLNRNYGEAGLLKIGVDKARYDLVLTLPPYEQVSPDALGDILNALEDNDAVVVNRSPRIDHKANRIQSYVFKTLLKMLAYNVPKDPGCGIRLSRKNVFDEVKLYTI